MADPTETTPELTPAEGEVAFGGLSRAIHEASASIVDSGVIQGMSEAITPALDKLGESMRVLVEDLEIDPNAIVEAEADGSGEVLDAAPEPQEVDATEDDAPADDDAAPDVVEA
jgi:hypothetical protein